MNAEAPAAPHLERASIIRAAASLGPLATGGKSLGQLISLLCNEGTAMHSIQSLIEQQPLLVARILRVANSAYYGRNREINTLQRAMTVLGTQAVRAIAVTCCFDRVMLQRLEGVLQDSGTFLRHSVATAIAAEALATAAGLACRQEAYVAGMLHNIGVAIQACVDDTGIRKLAEARRHSRSTTTGRVLEGTHCKVTHEMCGGLVLDAWQLPTCFVSVAAHHHEPAGAPASEQPFVALIHIASAAAAACNCSFVLEELAPAIPPELLHCAGVAQDHLNEVTSHLEERVTAFCDSLSF
jgi:HD-like signal output (HDOD) protein